MDFSNDKLEWIEYDLLKDEPNVIALTFLRQGGTSQNHFATLNISDKVGDHPDCVKGNREVVKEFLKAKKIIYPDQQHKTSIVEVTDKNKDQHFACDGLVTKEKFVALAIAHADCQAALFYDPINNVIGAVHAGWRGLVQDIYKNTIEFMQKKFNTKPSDIIVAVSACIGKDHAEFKNFKKEFPKEFWKYEIKDKLFDLQKIAEDQLLACGILEKNIEIYDDCTFCNKKDYFSFRRDKDTGRNGSYIMLK